jgi:hypothetical protein
MKRITCYANHTLMNHLQTLVVFVVRQTLDTVLRIPNQYNTHSFNCLDAPLSHWTYLVCERSSSVLEHKSFPPRPNLQSYIADGANVLLRVRMGYVVLVMLFALIFVQEVSSGYEWWMIALVIVLVAGLWFTFK